MHSSTHYREQAARARGWARDVLDRELSNTLERMARDFDHIAEDLEHGLIEITHPALLPQRRQAATAVAKGLSCCSGPDRIKVRFTNEDGAHLLLNLFDEIDSSFAVDRTPTIGTA